MVYYESLINYLFDHIKEKRTTSKLFNDQTQRVILEKSIGLPCHLWWKWNTQQPRQTRHGDENDITVNLAENWELRKKSGCTLTPMEEKMLAFLEYWRLIALCKIKNNPNSNTKLTKQVRKYASIGRNLCRDENLLKIQRNYLRHRTHKYN